MNAPRETSVLTAVMTLVDSLLTDFDVVELLTDLTEQCTGLLDVDAAGLLLADTRHHLHLMAATSRKSHDLEMLQLQADEGPCLDCFRTGQPVSAPSLDEEKDRWPRFAAAATDAGIASVHAVPLRAAGTVLGAMGLFGTQIGSLDDADLLAAQTLAHVASVAILQEHPRTRVAVGWPLRAALTQRVIVDQACGYLAGLLAISVEDAFALLRRHARTSPQHLTDSARQVISREDADHEGILRTLTELASPTTVGDTGPAAN